MSDTLQPSVCLDFWFHDDHRAYWFEKSLLFDAKVRQDLAGCFSAATAGRLRDWPYSAEGCLALILLLDQVPRNLHRDSPDAYAQDEQARAVARRGLHRGHDLRLSAEQRLFFYLPFEHSEDLVDQYLGLALMGSLPDESYVGWAQAHLDLIERFGRFPHRNAVLGRRSTPEEEVYLSQEGAGF